MPPASINPFEYSSILVSIILGLGITQLLSAFSELLYNYKKVSFYWPQTGWALFVLFLHIQDWFITYQLRDKPVWHLSELVFVLLYPVSLFIAAKILFPTNTNEESRDMKVYYMSQFPVLFGIMTISILLSVVFNCWLLGESLIAQLPILLFLLVLMYVSLRKIRQSLVHQVIACTICIAAVVSVIIENERWVIK
mgnify:CR=1 FL=1